jgi:Icc-related predicted phosphoesterase
MNNFGILKQLIESYSKDIALNNKLLVALIVFISINLITTIINIISQHRLKNKDKKIISFKIKEEKRILIFEAIYQKLDKMTFFSGKDDSENLLKSIQETEKNISSNKIYIGKKELKLMYNVTDYFKTVASDYRKKDYASEIKLFDKLSDTFNK